jgi:hypothetical protein
MGSHLETNVLPPSRQRELPGQPRKWIGQSLKRVEDRRFLLGKGQYIDDYVVPHMAHAATVRSPHAHARIVSIDTTRAKALPGVIGVFTGADLATVVDPCPSFASPPVTQRAMAIEKVRHVGEVVAAIVAVDRYVAEDAADLVEVEYEILPANVDIEASLEATGDAVIHPADRTGNKAHDESFKFGPVDEDFARADHIIKRPGHRDLRLYQRIQHSRRRIHDSLQHQLLELHPVRDRRLTAHFPDSAAHAADRDRWQFRLQGVHPQDRHPDLGPCAPDRAAGEVHRRPAGALHQLRLTRQRPALRR